MPMDSPPCLYSLIIYLATIFLASQTNPISGHHSFHLHHYHTPLINLTKHIYFPKFNPFQDIKLLGSARISEKTSTIQIPDATTTVDLTYKAGRAIYSSPVRLFDPLTQTPASFQTTFSFQFNTTSTTTSGSDSSESFRSGGGGLAFVIVPDELTVGRGGPWLGILNDACDNYYKAFAVEFDSSFDPEFGDPNDDHVGINLGQIVSIKTAYASDAGVSLHDGLVHRAWIFYDGEHKWIDIYLGFDENRVIPTKPLLSASLDLSRFFKEYMFVGFSASTGNNQNLTEIHNLISWNFSSKSQAYLQIPNSSTTCHRNVARQVSKYSGISPNSHHPSSFDVFVAVIGLCILACLSFYCNSSNKERGNSLSMILPPDKKQKPIPPSNKPHRFALQEIYRATGQFSKRQVLSSDSMGVLYRGTLSNGCQVMVKRFSARILKDLSRSRMLKEINAITNQISNYPNLATIRGWYCDDRETIIICDYIQNGSLDNWLLNGLGVLPWTRRFKIIKDIAQALSYLHSRELIHGNLKITSVFLDTSYRAVLGNYGFIHHRSESGKSYSNDVYEFGMLVMEIVAGKRKFDCDMEGGKEETTLLGFAWRMHERKELVEMVDKRMESCVNSEEAVRVLEIGLSCTLSDGPSMKEVVEFLNKKKTIPSLPPSRSALFS